MMPYWVLWMLDWLYHHVVGNRFARADIVMSVSTIAK